MSKIGPSRASRLRKALTVLRELTDTLPSLEEKAEIDSSLQQIISYLSEAKSSIAAMPGKDEVQDLLVAADRLEQLLDKAESSPALAKALGLERPARRKAPRSTPKAPSQDSKRLIDILTGLNSDQARDLLLDPGRYSLSQIKGAAEGLGIRVQSRWSRETIAGKIVSHLTNLRGYRLLRKG